MKGVEYMFKLIFTVFIRKIKELIFGKKRILGAEQSTLIVSVARQIYLNTNVLDLLLRNGHILQDCNDFIGGIFIWNEWTEHSPYSYRLTHDRTGVLIAIDICESYNTYIKDFQVAISDKGERIFFRWKLDDEEEPFTEWFRLR